MGIACLSFHSITKTLVVSASIPTNTNSPSPQSNTDPKPPPVPVPVPTKTASTGPKSTTTLPLPRKKRVQNRLQQQLNLMHIERVIGAGSYRDYEKPIDQDKKKKEKKSGFMEEGPVEKKLRETGEWVITKTDGEFRSNELASMVFDSGLGCDPGPQAGPSTNTRSLNDGRHIYAIDTVSKQKTTLKLALNITNTLADKKGGGKKIETSFAKRKRRQSIEEREKFYGHTAINNETLYSHYSKAASLSETPQIVLPNLYNTRRSARVQSSFQIRLYSSGSNTFAKNSL
ncbi:unnamed protein product [Dovyalis caffra]|uniref:Uncharacterized protein n=1 Tax=Dovyalis caffra TaxID=77055 RepID=A0AAV1R2M4_9ROSI|nr:unnamed protein product [Dovyalis caffra]